MRTHHAFTEAVPSSTYARCTCGLSGTRALVAMHITNSQLPYWRDDDATPVGAEDHLDDGTKAHYLPIDPRPPATMADRPSPPELPPPPAFSPTTTSIAEAFQTMLRDAFQAGLDAAASGETFEIWYQREVLR